MRDCPYAWGVLHGCRHVLNVSGVHDQLIAGKRQGFPAFSGCWRRQQGSANPLLSGLDTVFANQDGLREEL